MKPLLCYCEGERYCSHDIVFSRDILLLKRTTNKQFLIKPKTFVKNEQANFFWIYKLNRVRMLIQNPCFKPVFEVIHFSFIHMYFSNL